MRNPARILIADDSPASLDILKTRLASQGYEVIAATDGQEALDAALAPAGPRPARRHDAEAGWLRGVPAAAGRPELPFIPIILVTAKDDTRDIVAGLDSGADEYLTKPVDHAALTARVRSILRTKALHDTVQGAGGRSSPAGTGRWSSASPSSWTSSSGSSRLKRFLSPQLAELVVSGGASSFWRATAARSRSCSATCAASPRSPRRPSPRR